MGLTIHLASHRLRGPTTETYMARHAYFIDNNDGQTVEFRDTVENGKLRAARGVRYNAHGKPEGYVEGAGWLGITRVIELKSNPSKHECDERCLNATGRVMKCECACGGRNHGRGNSVCMEVA